MSMFGDDVLNGLIKYGQEYLYIMVDPVAGLVFVNGTKLGKQFLLVDRPDIVDSFSKLCLKKGQTEKPGIIPVHLYANSKSADDEPDFQSKDTTDVTPILIKPEPVSEDEEEKEKTLPDPANSTDKETEKATDISKDTTISTPTGHMTHEDNSAMFTQIHPQEDDEDDNTVDNNEDLEEPSETPSRGQKRKHPYASEDSASENTTHCDTSDVAVKVEVKDTCGKNDPPRRSLRTPKKKAYFTEDETVWEEVTYPSADGKTVVDVKPKIMPAAQESEDMNDIDDMKPIEMFTKSSSVSVEWDSSDSEDIPVSGSEKKHCQKLNHLNFHQNATSKNKEKGGSVHTKGVVTLFKKKDGNNIISTLSKNLSNDTRNRASVVHRGSQKRNVTIQFVKVKRKPSQEHSQKLNMRPAADKIVNMSSNAFEKMFCVKKCPERLEMDDAEQSFEYAAENIKQSGSDKAIRRKNGASEGVETGNKNPDDIAAEICKSDPTSKLEMCCKFCDRKFKYYENFIKHLDFHFKQDKQVHKCNICNKTYTNRSNLYKHKIAVHDKKKLMCDYCGTMKSASFLNRHIKVVHFGGTIHECGICGKKFKDSGTLRRHRQIHGDREFTCDECGKSYSTRQYLMRHKQIHRGKLPYRCEFCEKCFLRDDALKSHLRVHTGDRPYQCEICLMKFNHNVSRKNHMKKVHDYVWQ